VSARSPDIPFADADWGAMLMAKGDLDGAIAKFESAHAKGPHFADPVEMWGEALIAQNRSDLALAKFEEADKYAPNWGRLHLKWSEALWWSGKRVDAKKQFAIATGLDLSAHDRTELVRLSLLGR
jgi:tetratricopeptide (TPR) repeat protein